MMVFSPISEADYEESAIQITYCKLFPLMMEDFLTRKDSQSMMRSTNLPVTTTVNTVVTTSTDAGTGLGQGSGQAAPAYTGSTPTAATRLLAKEKEAIKNAGGIATEAVLQTALGS